MDQQDIVRALSNKEKLRAALREKITMTNHEARAVAGVRAMGRCFELQQEGEPITVRKLDRSTWQLRYNLPALGRSAEHRVDPAARLPLFPEHESGWQER